MGRPLKIKYSGATAIGVQEMSDADISDLILPLVAANWSGLSEVSGPSGSVVRTLSIAPPSGYNYVSRGIGYNTETDSIGTHPRTTSTTTTYTIVQNEYDPGLSTTAGVRPIQQSLVGNEVKISVMTNQDIINDVMPVIVNSILTGGQGAYYLGVTSSGPPATGTWTTVSNMTDNYYNTSNVYQSIQYTLWLRTDAATTGTIRPLTITNTAGGETRFTEMTNSEIQQLASFVGEYIRTTGIGKYSFSVSAPGSGTWVSRGSFTNTVNNIVDTGYVGVYIGYFTGTFTGAYTSHYTGSYVGYYTGVYQGLYSGVYAGSYVGYYVGSYDSWYAGIYNTTYIGYYSRTFSGNYSGQRLITNDPFLGSYARYRDVGYTAVRVNVNVGYFTSSYTGSWTNVYNVNYVATVGYAGSYVRYRTPYAGLTYVGYYVGYYAGADAYTGSYVRYRTPYAGGAYYTGYYAGGYGTANYTGTVSNTYTGIRDYYYVSYYVGYYALTWTRNYVGYYLGIYTGDRYYAGSYGGSFVGTFAGGYVTGYLGYYTRAYSGTYVGYYSGLYAGTYAGNYAGTYAGAYLGTYASTYIGSYNNSFSRTFTGSYSGLTVQSAVTTTTYQLWVRTA
jgi:hypothetical protein